jgi:hypothetical protein
VGEDMKIYVAMIVMLTFAWLVMSLAFIQSLEREYGKSRDAEQQAKD